MGVGGQVKGSGVEEEEEEVEEQRESERIERAEDVRSMFRSEKVGRWRRRCERIVVCGLLVKISVCEKVFGWTHRKFLVLKLSCM